MESRPPLKYTWAEWHKISSWIPRRSVYGRWIIGPMYKRCRWEDVYAGGDFSGYIFDKTVRAREYISKKELFKWKLANGNNDTSTN